MTSTDAFTTASAFLASNPPIRKGDRCAQRILLNLYSLLANGRPVSLQALAETSGVSVQEVEDAVSHVSPSAMQYDEGREIISFGGLSILPTEHRITVNDQPLFTWCAFDCLFAAELLDAEVHINSICPVTDAAISVRVSPDGIEFADPVSTVLTFVTPDRAACSKDVRGAFCQHVNFLCSEDAANEWVSKNPNAIILTLSEAFELGRQRNRQSFGYAII